MMPEDELAELAEDIKANGLIHPIILDADGLVLDGRNRLRACEIAKVEPRFERLDDRNPRDFITSVNLNRRNLSNGQKAMAYAILHPEPEKGGRGKLSSLGESLGISRGAAQNLLSEARKILKHSEDLAQDVLHRGTHFDVAQAELRQRQQNVRMIIDQARTAASQLQKLPDQLIIIQAVDRLTDADLAMIDEDRQDVDPYADLTAKDIEALLAAARKLPEMPTPPEEEEEDE
jgi:hypothetical protein